MNAVASEAPLAGREADLAALFSRRGAVRRTVPILQPAEPYLNTAGEALRRRIFLTHGEARENLCLRPDFTIPVCRDHVGLGDGLPARHAYSGLVFRQRPGGPGEFVQAGIEDLGEPDRAGADARAIADALAGLDACGVAGEGRSVVLGDQSLFEAFLRGVGLPKAWQDRLIRTFGDDAQLEAALGALVTGEDDGLDRLDAGIADLARAGEAGELTRAIRARMEADGLPVHSGRTPGEIAERLVAKVEAANVRLSADHLALLRAFLAIDCPLGLASERLTDLAKGADVDLGAAVLTFEARNRALLDAGVDFEIVRYRAAFGRPIDYYTGLVFEIRAGGLAEPLAGGGRYDRLLTLLGAPEPVPAVGFSIWLDRVATVAGGEGA